MTLIRARELLKMQAECSGFYNANSAQPFLSEVLREHGQAAVDQWVADLDL